MSKVSPSIQRLRDALSAIPHGLVKVETDNIIRLLADCWPDLQGTDRTAMQGFKLKRAEQLSWNPPFLSFTIERHGGTVLGSTRAELHNWSVNLDFEKADHTKAGRRQLIPAAPKLDVKPYCRTRLRRCVPRAWIGLRSREKRNRTVERRKASANHARRPNTKYRLSADGSGSPAAIPQ